VKVPFVSQRNTERRHRVTQRSHRENRTMNMKIAFLITGSGGSFYCSNCYRDMLYFRAVKMAEGVTAAAIPLYLPPEKIYSESGFDPNVFFGAISLYIREKIPFMEQMPSFIDKLLDSPPLLRIAAKQAGTTRTEGLEHLTLNMIDSHQSSREKEVERLVKYMNSTGKPDVIHLSNALIIGLARQIKNLSDVKVVCSLQNEDDWINDMAEPFQSQAWKMIANESVNIDAFISPSRYYRDFFISKTGISGDKIKVVPSGIESFEIQERKRIGNPPAIGFFSRVSKHNGFDKIVDAFIMIKSGKKYSDLTLHVCGGYTSDDKPFIKEQIKKIKDHGFKSSVHIYPEFVGSAKQNFLSSIDIMSVPVRKPDAYGLYILESNAAGIPVVQPATGAFPEIIDMTGGGITYSPDTVDELASNVMKLLHDKVLADSYGKAGSNAVKEKLTLSHMSSDLISMYKSLF
jgi:glycosyltransferase involved in cell wall biosynthesis